MSPTATDPTAPDPTAPAAASTHARGEFDYRPLPVTAPAAAILGVCGLAAFVSVGGIVLAAAGVVLALFALRTIRREQTGGRGPALTGLVLASVSLVGGPALQAVRYAGEVPEGYKRLNFSEDIAARPVAPAAGGGTAFDKSVAALDDEPVFIKGYMYDSGQTRYPGFVFVKDSGDCCFGAKPAVTDMILVTLPPGESVPLYTGLAAVAGTFQLRPEGGRDDLSPVYQIEATQVEPARTAF